MAIDENKQKALAAALGQIEKQFGKGSIMRLLRRHSAKVKPVRLSMPSTRWTRSMPVNWALISTTCCAPSRTPASRHWKSVTPWRVLAQ